MGCACSNQNFRNLTEDDIVKIQNSTNMNRDDIIQSHKDFLKDCPNGLLSRRKFVRTLKKNRQDDRGDDFFNAIFNCFDTDQSGKLDFREYLIGLNLANPSDPARMLKLVFSIYDADKNGKIEKKELFKVINAVRELNSGMSRELVNTRFEILFERFDTNRDGVISEEEFLNCLTKDQTLLNQLLPIKSI